MFELILSLYGAPPRLLPDGVPPCLTLFSNCKSKRKTPQNPPKLRTSQGPQTCEARWITYTLSDLDLQKLPEEEFVLPI